MKNDKFIKVNSKEFVFFVRAIHKAFPEFMHETIKYFSGFGSDEHLRWLYVISNDFMYMFDSSNGLSFNSILFFKIPLAEIKKVGYLNIGLNEVSYVSLINGDIIPIKVYTANDIVLQTMEDINDLIVNGTIKIVHSIKECEVSEMIMSKPIIKRTEFEDDSLSPFIFKNRHNGLKEYINKRKRLIKKMKLVIDSAELNKNKSNYNLLEIKVIDVINI